MIDKIEISDDGFISITYDDGTFEKYEWDDESDETWAERGGESFKIKRKVE